MLQPKRVKYRKVQKAKGNMKGNSGRGNQLSNGMFGLLGPNGAGKSSLMRTLATLQEADTGSAFLDDIDITQIGKVSKQKVVEKIKRIIKKYYSFVGYTKFANYIQHISKVSSNIKNKQRIISEKLNKVFSGSLIVIDVLRCVIDVHRICH